MGKIITISREFGSGGRELGRRLAEELGFEYFDKEKIAQVYDNVGYTDIYSKVLSDKHLMGDTLHYANSFYLYESIHSPRTETITKEQQALRSIANKGNCVIVGRASNSVLKDFNPFNIFVYSDLDYKIKRCKVKGSEEESELTNENIERQIHKIDKNRKKYYESICDLKWGNKLDFDLCINTSNIEIKKIVPALANYIKSSKK